MGIDSNRFVRMGALLAVLALSACGWAEIPEGSRPITRAPSVNTFVMASAVTVGKGDTVYSIARRHQISPRALIDANRLRPPYILIRGQRLVLPRGRLHTVRTGEFMSMIAKRYRVDTFSLARLNGIASPYTIYPGQKLRIPGAGAGGAPVNVTRAEPAPLKVSPTGPKSQTTTKTKIPTPPTRAGRFSWPLKGRLVSGYGPKKEGLYNDGVNIAAARGTVVKAAENGVVAYAGNEIRGFGNLLLIKHEGGWVTAYAHNDTLLVARGEKVSRGQDISKVGSTGSVTTPQLHFELRKGSNAVDPAKYLR